MKPTKYLLLLFFVWALSPGGCSTQPSKKINKTPVDKSLASVPAWSKEAIWYQIFVERFRNGDTLNDPAPADMYGSFPDKIPDNWKITPWGHDWYAHEVWLVAGFRNCLFPEPVCIFVSCVSSW